MRSNKPEIKSKSRWNATTRFGQLSQRDQIWTLVGMLLPGRFWIGSFFPHQCLVCVVTRTLFFFSVLLYTVYFSSYDKHTGL